MFYKKIVIAMSVLFLSACGSKNSTPATEITVDMNEFLFLPASITIPANQAVILTFTNSGAQEHDFVIEKISITDMEMEGASSGQQHHMGGETSEYDLHISTASGSTSKLSFTATEPGTYKIFCSIQGHEVAGMVGELIVVSQ
ncbi:MAG: cupredoxin domain-containing protein [Anaerolineales bacterium]|nr:cupredoxin domain-containing protein [Anaerolineales bacterium]